MCWRSERGGGGTQKHGDDVIRNVFVLSSYRADPRIKPLAKTQLVAASAHSMPLCQVNAAASATSGQTNKHKEQTSTCITSRGERESHTDHFS